MMDAGGRDEGEGRNWIWPLGRSFLGRGRIKFGDRPSGAGLGCSKRKQCAWSWRVVFVVRCLEKERGGTWADTKIGKAWSR